MSAMQIIHGRRATYTTLGCRCQKCRKANNDYQAPYQRTHRQRKRAKGHRCLRCGAGPEWIT